MCRHFLNRNVNARDHPRHVHENSIISITGYANCPADRKCQQALKRNDGEAWSGAGIKL